MITYVLVQTKCDSHFGWKNFGLLWFYIDFWPRNMVNESAAIPQTVIQIKYKIIPFPQMYPQTCFNKEHWMSESQTVFLWVPISIRFVPHRCPVFWVVEALNIISAHNSGAACLLWWTKHQDIHKFQKPIRKGMKGTEQNPFHYMPEIKEKLSQSGNVAE